MNAVKQFNGPPPSLFRRKKEQKYGITYTLLLVGSSGTGKTTFANNLLESTIFSHKYQTTTPENDNPIIKVVNPTKVVTFNSKNGIPSAMVPFDPKSSHLEPGITLTSTSVEVCTQSYFDDSHEKIFFNLIDTHGFGENLDNQICFDEVVVYLEQQFDSVLAEETRIKRNPRFGDGRVHTALYFIEATGHGLRELDIETMKRLSRYTNVLPIISKADSFTREELQLFKMNILRDIEAYNVPVYKFEVDEGEEDLEIIEEVNNLAKLQPFAVCCSDLKDSKGRYVRSYAWGDVLIDSKGVSDFVTLKNVLFGSHLQDFKDTTHNLLYENYRAEKLSSMSEWASSRCNSEKNRNNNTTLSTAPSLSNFISLVNNGNIASQRLLSPVSNYDTNSYNPSDMEANNSFNVNDSSLGRMSTTIKHDNEGNNRNIKTPSSNLAYEAQDRSKLRNISETLPYVLRHERIVAKQQRLEELELQSTKELQKRIQELERKAMELKLREKMLKKNHTDKISVKPVSLSKSSNQEAAEPKFSKSGQMASESSSNISRKAINMSLTSGSATGSQVTIDSNELSSFANADDSLTREN